jgi:CBS domain-containing protein
MAEVGAEIHEGVAVDMLAKDVMTTKIVKVSPDNSVRHACKIMLDNHVSGIPVVDDDGHLLGIISEGDLIRRTELGGGAFAPTDTATPAEARADAYVKRTSWKVGDTMTRDPVTIDEETSLTRVAQLMQDHGIKRVPVVRAGELIGIVGRADLLRAILAANLDETASGDEGIQRSIVTRLGENTGLEGLGVKVTVADGTVHLWGNVETAECRRAARVVAESVRGVRSVVEHFSQSCPEGGTGN